MTSLRSHCWVEYSVGFAVTEKVRAAIKRMPAKVWTPASVPTAASA